jgi:hypothetical protein
MALKLLKQFTPGLSAFLVTVSNGYQLFGAIFERSHQNQDTTTFFIESNIEINAVGPPASEVVRQGVRT